MNFGWPERPATQPEQGEQEHERDVADDGMDR